MNDVCASAGLLTLDAALKQLMNEIQPLKTTEKLFFSEGLGRILAADTVSPIDVPGYDNSAMDGYALRLKDLDTTDCLPVVGKAFAGHPFSGKLPESSCIRIMTGACVPEGADTVIMQEQTEVIEKGIHFLQKPGKLGANVRFRGEGMQEGEQVFRKGHRLSPQDIGLLASLGISEIDVFSKLKVAIFSTGDELVLPGEPLKVGEVYDSNRFVVQAMLQKLPVDIIDFGRIPDNPKLLRQTFINADEQADVVISSGGVSVGEADYTRHILESLGKTVFWKLAIKPGKPFAFGHLPHSYFFGLPGNPVSATVTFHQLVAPALRHMMNNRYHTLKEMPAICTETLKKSPGRKEFQRGVWVINEKGMIEVSSSGSQGSGILRSMNVANCYIVLPENQGKVEAGEKVTIQLFDDILQ
ncbi:Molybdopterin molybdenumtransferase [invertebrate metagenome]|uniref:molybdopterin molybdotransferase n=1 Tax=invertebrate metagenome TaxID=1711999 RepID=A0A2H9T8A2_9ZZZZ